MISRDLGYPLQEAEPLPSVIFLAERLMCLWIDAGYSALVLGDLLFHLRFGVEVERLDNAELCNWHWRRYKCSFP